MRHFADIAEEVAKSHGFLSFKCLSFNEKIRLYDEIDEICLNELYK